MGDCAFCIKAAVFEILPWRDAQGLGSRRQPAVSFVLSVDN
jgi:hypothetical protein